MNIATARKMVQIDDKLAEVTKTLAALEKEGRERASSLSLNIQNCRPVVLTITDEVLKTILRSEQQALKARLEMLEKNA